MTKLKIFIKPGNGFYWYVNEEGNEVGPFDTLNQAENDLNNYLNELEDFYMQCMIAT